MAAAVVPPGTADNSPAIHRWVLGEHLSTKSRQGRKANLARRRVDHPFFRPWRGFGVMFMATTQR